MTENYNKEKKPYFSKVTSSTDEDSVIKEKVETLSNITQEEKYILIDQDKYSKKISYKKIIGYVKEQDNDAL